MVIHRVFLDTGRRAPGNPILGRCKARYVSVHHALLIPVLVLQMASGDQTFQQQIREHFQVTPALNTVNECARSLF
jgi:hypothetical protein